MGARKLLRGRKRRGVVGRFPKQDALTERQQTLLGLLAGGATLGDAAQEIGLGREGAKDECRRIYQFYGVNSQAAAVAAALRSGAIT